MTNEEMFVQWLSENVAADRLSNYLMLISDVEAYARKKNLITGSIYALSDSGITSKIVSGISSDLIYRFIHRKHIRSITEVAQLFHRYTKEKQKLIAEINLMPQSEEQTSSIARSDSLEFLSPKQPEVTADIESSSSNPKDPLIVFLNERGLEYIDHRDRLGCLWIIGGQEITETLRPLQRNGVSIHFMEGGGKTTSGRDAWWTKDKPSTLVIAEEKPAKNTRESRAGNRREDFKNWLESQFSSSGTIRTTSWAVSKISEFAEKYQLVSESLFSVEDTDRLAAIWNQLNAISEFMAFRKKNGVLTFAFNKYLQYRGGEGSASTRREIQPGVAVSCHDIKNSRVEFEAWLKESGTPADFIQTYSSSVKRIGDALLENGTEYRHLYSIFGISRLEQIQDALEQNLNYTSAIENVTLQDVYALRKYIQFRKSESSEGLDKITHSRYATILKENFENGFRVGSLIDRNRFKQFYQELYGEEIAQDDDSILEIIKQVGELQDDRIFVRNGRSSRDLLDDIQEDIAKVFKKGASCVFVSSVFEKYRQKLATRLKIYVADVLREQLLATNFGAYSGAKKYFFLKGRTPDASQDVKALMIQTPLPMSYDQIHEVLWYIPIDTIKQALKTDDMVNVAPETYFYAGNLPISTSELERIAELMHAQLSQKSFITDTELRAMIHQHCPSVYINTEFLTTLGLRNALAVRLKERFSFNGAIISEHGQEINMAQVVGAFCDTRDNPRIFRSSKHW